MAKTSSDRTVAGRYMVRVRPSHKKIDWRDYAIPTKNKKKRRVSEMVDKIVYGV